MTDSTDQATAAAARIAMARRAYELAVEVGDEDFVVFTEEFGTVLAALDGAQETTAKLTAENDTLFVDYSTEKTQHELFNAAFDEVRADRDRLAARVTELEAALAAPCDGTRCEQSSAAHCHACAEAETAKILARVADLTDRIRAQSGGDETRGHEWATRTPDGTRTRQDGEEQARAFARTHPGLKVDCREVRHYVGPWREVDGNGEAAGGEVAS